MCLSRLSWLPNSLAYLLPRARRRFDCRLFEVLLMCPSSCSHAPLPGQVLLVSSLVLTSCRSALLFSSHCLHRPVPVFVSLQWFALRLFVTLHVTRRCLFDSAEIRGLPATLTEARRAAQDRPLAAQVEECQAFIRGACSVCRTNRSQSTAVGQPLWRVWQGFETSRWGGPYFHTARRPDRAAGARTR